MIEMKKKLRNKGLSFNDADLEAKFLGWRLALCRAKILGLSCFSGGKKIRLRLHKINK